MTLEEFYQIPNVSKLVSFLQKNIHYGFLCSLDGQIYTRVNTPDSNTYENLLFNYYYLQNPEELLKSGYGLCFDQVELERIWFLKHDMIPYSFYTPFHNHSFLAFQSEDGYGLIENTFKKLNGVHYGESLEDVVKNYIALQIKGQRDKVDLYLYERINFGGNFQDYLNTVRQEENKVRKLIK